MAQPPTPPNQPLRPSGRERLPVTGPFSPLRVDATPIRAHYDQDDAVFASMLDPVTRMYSCAWFKEGNETLAQAQVKMTDHLLGKLNLQPGETALDVGFGWNYVLLRAQDLYGVKGIGLTLSNKQAEHARQHILVGREGIDLRVQGWEEFDEPVDAVFLKGSFEHFGQAKHNAFFERMHHILPPDHGRMALHTIFINRDKVRELSREDRRRFLSEFLPFLGTDIFPQGYLATHEDLVAASSAGGFEIVTEETFGPNYVPTLEHWRKNLVVNRDAFIAATDEATYKMYEGPFLTGTQEWFDQGSMDVIQLLLRPAANSLQTPSGTVANLGS